ncbi:hypothetical protein [Pseudomonas cremoricolorata]|uniref:hypothetical protein n=1 Tax=Pseudomonas cremoricolorata TaxID=157783 RepID=UPI0012B59F5E|nr:hypothetical protein [Pseudomonas cremoricolorata]
MLKVGWINEAIMPQVQAWSGRFSTTHLLTILLISFRREGFNSSGNLKLKCIFLFAHRLGLKNPSLSG